MRARDASSALYAWDNYPPDQFPPLWRWLAGQIAAGELQISVTALEEVGHKAPECAVWLREQNISVHGITEDILLEALRIKQLLGIEGERYGAGVGENDLFIIASARLRGAILVSNEARQPQLSPNRAKYKIPAVCGMASVEVRCESFIEYLKASGAVFAWRTIQASPAGGLGQLSWPSSRGQGYGEDREKFDDPIR